MHKLDAIILAGGFGTRLNSVIGNSQKVIANIDGTPFLQLLLNWISAMGIKRIIFALGYQAEQVKSLLEKKVINCNGVTIITSIEDHPLGTGGALSNALLQIESRNIVVLNGDSFSPVDLPSIYDFHKNVCSNITITVKRVSDTSRFGLVEFNKDSTVVKFTEKNRNSTVSGDGYINTGIYVIRRSIIENIPADRFVSFEKEVLPIYIGKGLYAKVHDKPFIDIGTPQSFKSAKRFFADLHI